MIELTKREKQWQAKRIQARNRRDLKVQIGLLLILVGLAAMMTEF